MPVDVARFAPPEARPTPALRWALAAAFAARAPALASEEECEAAADLALRLDLAPRIATRLGRERLRAALGEARAERLLRVRAKALAAALRIREAEKVVAEEAERLAAQSGIDPRVVPLKLAALLARGATAEGERYASDLDVLVDAGAAEPLAAALVARGFARSAGGAPEQHVAALAHPELGAVEVHRVLLGVRVAGSGSAALADLEGAGLVETVSGRPLLVADVLAAHALAHALAQHGPSPRSYPLLRVVADLADLGFDRFDAAARERIARWIERDVAPRDVEALAALVATLARGELPDRDSGAAGPRGARWLDHFLAGALDETYGEERRVAALAPVPTDRGRATQLAAQLRSLLFLTGDEVEAIYGPQRSRLAVLGRQLARPFDLAARAGRAVRARLARRPNRAGRVSRHDRDG